jgi:hypothetical protein
LQEQPTTPAQVSSGAHYAFKPALMGAAHQFELTDAGLSWRLAGRSGVWPYTDITAIRLSYRPVTMQADRFRADIHHARRARITVVSTSWQTAALMAAQNQDYRSFMVELHERMARAGSKAVLTGGLGRNAYAAGLTLVILLAIGMAALFIRALLTGELSGALFLLAFAALFGWQIGGFLWRNRPLVYSFSDIPARLLPVTSAPIPKFAPY